VAILAFDTSTKVLTIALAEDDKILVQYRLNVDYTHSEYLMKLIDDSLKIAKLERNEIKAIAVSKGPGSFTGLRIGLAVAKGLNISLGSKIYSYTSLEALAATQIGSKEKVLTVLPAQRGEVYGAFFDVESEKPKIIGQYFLGTPKELVDTIKYDGNIKILGEGYDKFFDEFNTLFENKVVSLPKSTMLADSSGLINLINYDLKENSPSENVHTLKPFYMRLSSAEEKRLLKESKNG
jgi:tRNA threonylcarbamoyladenosine biosynthesis protein TsaB